MEEIRVIDRRRFAGAASSETNAVPRKPISIEDEAKEVLDELIHKHGKVLSDEEYEHYLDQTKQQIVKQRVFYRASLQRAQVELGKVSFRMLSAGDAGKQIGGLRQKFIINIGRFVYGRGEQWIFEPTQDDLINRAMRFIKLKDAQSKGVLLHKQLMKTCTFDDEGNVTEEGWKKEMYDNIQQELDALEVE